MKRNLCIVIVSAVLFLLLFVGGCEWPTAPTGYGDNTVQFKVTYRGNPIEGAVVDVAELNIRLWTDNNGLTNVVNSGSNRSLSGTVSYGQISKTWSTSLRIGSNLISIGL